MSWASSSAECAEPLHCAGRVVRGPEVEGQAPRQVECYPALRNGTPVDTTFYADPVGGCKKKNHNCRSSAQRDPIGSNPTTTLCGHLPTHAKRFIMTSRGVKRDLVKASGGGGAGAAEEQRREETESDDEEADDFKVVPSCNGGTGKRGGGGDGEGGGSGGGGTGGTSGGGGGGGGDKNTARAEKKLKATITAFTSQYRGPSWRQGLTLVHCSAQRERCLWDRGRA
jgi:hypothetical protein